MKRLLTAFLIITCIFLPLRIVSADLTRGADKVFSVPGNYQVKIDYESGTNPIYVGYADKGVSDGASAWFIIKITWDANDNPTAITSANNVDWTNRATHSYT